MVAQFVQPLCTPSFTAKLSVHNGCTNCAPTVHAQFCRKWVTIASKTERAQWLHRLCNHCARSVLQKMRHNCGAIPGSGRGGRKMKNIKKCKTFIFLMLLGGPSHGVLYGCCTRGPIQKHDDLVGAARLEALTG